VLSVFLIVPGLAEPEEAAATAGPGLNSNSNSNSDSAPRSTTTDMNAGYSSSNASTRPRTAHSGEFDPISWIMEDPLRAAIAAVLATIVMIYIWSLIKGLFGGSKVHISKKRLAQLEKFESMFLKHGHPGDHAAGKVAENTPVGRVGKVTTQTIIKKIIQPKPTT
jgi:hypothetical protein